MDRPAPACSRAEARAAWAAKRRSIAVSSFISLSEGTIEVDATDDPDVSTVSFVEYLDATSAGVSDVLKGVQHNYDSLVAVAHGGAVPACP